MNDARKNDRPDDLDLTQPLRPAANAGGQQADAEKTQLNDAAGARAGSADKTARLDDTQSLPHVTDASNSGNEAPIQQPFPQQGEEQGQADVNDVRELSPDKALQNKAKEKDKKWLTRKRKKAILLGVGFLIAVFIGFVLAGYRQDQADLQNNERQHQEQQMQARQQQLDAQEGDLQKQRQALEKKKKELEQQQRDLERQQGRLEGRGQAMQESADGESGVQKFLDKVTGQADKKKQAAAENQQQSADAAATAADVQQSINDAQQKLDDVQQKLDDVQSLKDEAGKVKDKAASTYAENKDTIDTVISYAKEGASLLGDLLFH